MSQQVLSCLMLVCLCAGRATGSRRPTGAEEDRAAASGWIRLAAHRHGFLQDERGTVTQIVFVLGARFESGNL